MNKLIINNKSNYQKNGKQIITNNSSKQTHILRKNMINKSNEKEETIEQQQNVQRKNAHSRYSVKNKKILTNKQTIITNTISDDMVGSNLNREAVYIEELLVGNGGLNVIGDTTIEGGLQVNGDLTIEGKTTFNDDVTVNGTLTVDDLVINNSLTVDTLNTETINATTGNFENLNVTDTITTETINATDGDFENLTVENLTVTNGTISSIPTNGIDIVNKTYVDTAIAEGVGTETGDIVVYINPSGDDNNNGLTPGTAFRTLHRALRHNVRNLIIHMAGGFYGTGFFGTTFNGRTKVHLIGDDDFVLRTGLTVISRIDNIWETTIGVSGPILTPGIYKGTLLRVLNGTLNNQTFSIVNNTNNTITLAGSFKITGAIVGQPIHIFRPAARIDVPVSKGVTFEGNDWFIENVNIQGPGSITFSCNIRTKGVIIQLTSGGDFILLPNPIVELGQGTVLSCDILTNNDNRFISAALKTDHCFINLGGNIRTLFFLTMTFDFSYIETNSSTNFIQTGQEVILIRSKILSNTSLFISDSCKIIGYNSEIEFTNGNLTLTGSCNLNISVDFFNIVRSGTNNANPIISLSNNSQISMSSNFTPIFNIINNSSGGAPTAIQLEGNSSISMNNPSLQQLTFSGSNAFNNLIKSFNSNVNLKCVMNINTNVLDFNIIQLYDMTKLTLGKIIITNPVVLTGKTFILTNELSRIVFVDTFTNSSGTLLDKLVFALGRTDIFMAKNIASSYSTGRITLGSGTGNLVDILTATITNGLDVFAQSDIAAGGDGSTFIKQTSF